MLKFRLPKGSHLYPRLRAFSPEVDFKEVTTIAGLSVPQSALATTGLVRLKRKPRRRRKCKHPKESLQEAAKTFVPPVSVQAAARRGLELRKKFGRGATAVGLARARGLASGRGHSLSELRMMNRFFIRHEGNKSTPPEKGNGKISWLLWGGDSAWTWAKSILRKEGLL